MLIYLQRAGFSGASGSELKGKKLGLHAFGNIGKIVANIAKGFGMEVYAFSPSLARNPKLGDQYGVTAITSPEELYDKSDIVSLHMPANDQTKGCINYDLMSRLPQNAIIINTARKEVINEADLVRIMEERLSLSMEQIFVPEITRKWFKSLVFVIYHHLKNAVLRLRKPMSTPDLPLPARFVNSSLQATEHSNSINNLIR